MATTTKPHKTVLVVDDDPWTRTVTAALLVGEGYEVMQAKNGEEALKVAGHERLDAILLDLALPTKSGLDVLRELKADAETCKTPVFVLSAYATLMGQDDARQADGLFQKPYDYDDLVSTLDRATSTRDPHPHLVGSN